MTPKILLVKCLTLLFRESQLVHKTESSRDLVRTIIDSIPVPEVGMGINSEREVVASLKDTILEMCQNPMETEYDKDVLLQQIKLNCDGDEKLYDIIATGIEKEMSESKVKTSIVNLQRALNAYSRQEQINETLSKAAYQFKFHRDKIKDINEFIAESIAQLEALQMGVATKDPAVVTDIDLSDEEAVRNIFTEAKSVDDGTGIMKLGWQDLNNMAQGGLRRGEAVLIGALQHKYKTGFTLSMMAQVAVYNKPYMFDAAKKPLILRISFEDEIVNNLQFLYQYFKYSETGKAVYLKDASVEEMTVYVRSKLQGTGYHVKLTRVDPSQWTYKHICNKVLEYEAQGYEVHVLMLDYLFKLPTTGVTAGLPNGHDKRDMFRRMRNFCSARKTTLVTPCQLSSEAKALIKGGLPEDRFVKEVAEKGYWDGCKTLDTEADLELHIHVFKHQKETYFSIQRGKHRLPTIVDDDYKYMLLKFPKGMPIPPDLEGEKISMRRLPMGMTSTNASEDLFAF